MASHPSPTDVSRFHWMSPHPNISQSFPIHSIASNDVRFHSKQFESIPAISSMDIWIFDTGVLQLSVPPHIMPDRWDRPSVCRPCPTMSKHIQTITLTHWGNKAGLTAAVGSTPTTTTVIAEEHLGAEDEVGAAASSSARPRKGKGKGRPRRAASARGSTASMTGVDDQGLSDVSVD
jgi:hypothetical protein